MSKKLDLKESVRVASNTNPIANLSEGPLFMDSICLKAGDRVLIKNGASADGIEPVSDKRNGIYIVKKIKATYSVFVRANDANNNKKVTSAMFTFVEEGSSNKDTGWILITNSPITLNETELKFKKFSDSGEISNNIQKLIDTNSDNISLNAFRIANQNAMVLNKMVDGSVDEYEDESLIDNDLSVDEKYDSANHLYETSLDTVKLLLHLNGAEGDTSTLDDSSSGHIILFNGDAKLKENFKKYGSSSLSFDGIGDFLSIADSGDWDIAGSNSDDQTLDCWIRHRKSGSQEAYISQYDNAGSNGWRLDKPADGSVRFDVYLGGVLQLKAQSVASAIIDDNLWHHVAMCKVADEYGIYVDGVQVAYTQDTNTATFSDAVNIGRAGFSSGTNYVNGNMDEIRLNKSNTFSASPNVGLTDTITVPTGESSGAGIVNTTLISEPLTALVQPDSARITIYEENIDVITINTDLKAFVSRDDGVTYTQVTLENKGEYESGKNVLAGTVDISSQPAGTTMRSKIETSNDKSLKIHGSGLFWA